MTARRRLIGVVLALVLLAVSTHLAVASPRVAVGSKAFTESIVLGELLAAIAEREGADVERRLDLGGTQLVYEALKSGEIDAYVEYTGTLLLETYATDALGDETELPGRLGRDGLEMLATLGFNNSYGIAVTPETAERLGLRTIGDLRGHPGLVVGMNNEFLERADGWPSVRSAYGLPPLRVVGTTHDLAYFALAEGETDAMIVYTTDAKIGSLGLIVLEDPLGHFPRYDAVIVARQDLAERAPAVAGAFAELEGSIDEAAMIELNRLVEVEGLSPGSAAASFLSGRTGETVVYEDERWWHRVLRYTREHAVLVAVPTGLAVLIAVPLGFVAAHDRRVGQAVLGVVGIVQTVPSLALLVLLVPVLAAVNGVIPVRALGPAPAIIALTAYGLLPIVRNTHAGVTQLDRGLRESMAVLGLGRWAEILKIELPLALPMIFAGIKTAAVINVGYATLGAFVAAGGYGTPILTWTRTQETTLLLEGAVPAMAMALAVQAGFDLLERAVVPRGLRRGGGGRASRDRGAAKD